MAIGQSPITNHHGRILGVLRSQGLGGQVEGEGGAPPGGGFDVEPAVSLFHQVEDDG